jgi:hypothetical protein
MIGGSPYLILKLPGKFDNLLMVPQVTLVKAHLAQVFCNAVSREILVAGKYTSSTKEDSTREADMMKSLAHPAFSTSLEYALPANRNPVSWYFFAYFLYFQKLLAIRKKT